MKVENVEIIGLESSIKASKYPMAIDIDNLTNEITDTVVKLGHSEGGHNQFQTGIIVNFDLTCSNKMWVEAERYRFLNFVSSQSTMHRISKMDINSQCNKYVDFRVICAVEDIKEEYLKNPTKENYLALLYNIPSGFELTARLTTNYRCLKNIYNQRKNHRLPEWREFCQWIESLPMFKELCINKEC